MRGILYIYQTIECVCSCRCQGKWSGKILKVTFEQRPKFKRLEESRDEAVVRKMISVRGSSTYKGSEEGRQEEVDGFKEPWKSAWLE